MRLLDGTVYRNAAGREIEAAEFFALAVQGITVVEAKGTAGLDGLLRVEEAEIDAEP